MKKWLIILCFLTVLICFFVFITYKPLPDVNSVQNQFLDNYDSISIITAFMESSGYENIYIYDDSGVMVADLEERQIDDTLVFETVKHLIKSGKYVRIAKRGNTIWFLQKKRIRNVGCGIAYTINGTDKPQIDYVTDLVALSAENWYYYAYDYEAMRSSRTVDTSCISTEKPTDPK